MRVFSGYTLGFICVHRCSSVVTSCLSSNMLVEFPGFFDLQVNGFAGVDFNSPGCTPEQLKHAVDALGKTGVTQFLPTLITSSFERFSSCARALVDFPVAAIAGIHMEGPYISPEDGARGAHPRAHVARASVEDFKRRQHAAGGRIVLVALGHTAATPQQIGEAIGAGATLATHLGNGCPQMLPRHPNVIWELLAADALLASMIVDGHHLPPSTVKAMVRAKGALRTILV